MNDVHNVFRRQRFKVEPVGRIEVGGDGFRIVVYRYDFIAQVFERADALYRRVVELNSLPDTDWPRAEYDDGSFGGLIFACG